MSPENTTDPEREERLNAALASWLEAAESGQVLDEQEFLGRHPEFAPELAQHLATWKRFAPINTPLPYNRGVDTPRSPGVDVPADPGRSRLPSGTSYTQVPSGRRDLPHDRYFADYELLEEIGHGGMGVVYKARQKNPNRLVALKMVRAGQWMSEADLQRFRNEGELVAQLDHPHVVPIYEVGQSQSEDVLYFSMKLMEGGSLAKVVASGQWPVTSLETQRRAAQLLIPIARAIHHAHQRGILHRDLKPSNILLDTEGRPHVTDFGLAKRVPILGDDAADPSLTETGAIVGTPPYMSPEQTAGKRGKITTATDVYGLGTILYALLTGRPPFQEETLLETLTQVKDREPAPPSGINARLDRDLETICLKCLEKEPARRYASAEALAEDLQRWLAGEPILARPMTRPARFWRWCRKNPVVAGLVALVTALLFTGVIGLATGLVVVSRARQTADEQRALLRQRLYPADLNRAYRLWQQGEIEGLADLLDQYLPQPGEEDLRGFEWYFLRQQIQRSQLQPRLTYRGHSRNVYFAIFSADGKSVASAGADGSIQLWDAKTGNLQARLPGHALGINGLDYSPDGGLLASASNDGTIRLWDLKKSTKVAELRAHKGEVGTAFFSPDGQTIVSGGQDGMIRLWDVASRGLCREWKAHGKRINIVLFSPDGRTLASTADDGKTIVWDATSGRQLYGLEHGSEVYCAMYSPDGGTLATADGADRVQLWDSKTGRLVKVLESHASGAFFCYFSPDGERLVTSDGKGMVRVTSLRTGVLLTQFRAHEKRTEYVQFAPNDQSIITASRDGTVRIWEPTSIRPCQPLAPDFESFQHVSFSPTRPTLALRSREAVELWELSTPDALRSLTIPAKDCQCCFSPDGSTLAVSDDQGSIRLVDAAQGSVRSVRPPNPAAVGGAFTFTQDGQRLAIYSSDGNVCLWHPGSGNEESCGQVKGDRQLIAAIPNSKSLAVIHDRHVNLWDGEQRAWHDSESLHTILLSAAASPDGRLLALGGSHQSLLLLDTRTAEKCGEFFGHQGDVRSVAFSPDGRTLASASADGTVRLWHVATRQELSIIENRGKPMSSVAFSADGKILATAGDPADDGHSVFLWRIVEE